VDEVYHAIVVRPLMSVLEWLWRFWDAKIVDGIADTASATRSTGGSADPEAVPDGLRPDLRAVHHAAA
jgi:hypothetical protein